MIALIIIGYLIGCFATYVITMKRVKYLLNEDKLPFMEYSDQIAGVCVFSALSFGGLALYFIIRLIHVAILFLNEKFNL